MDNHYHLLVQTKKQHYGFERGGAGSRLNLTRQQIAERMLVFLAIGMKITLVCADNAAFPELLCRDHQGRVRQVHLRDQQAPATPRYPPESWSQAGFGREIELAFVVGGELLTGFNAADKTCVSQRRKEGGIS